MELHSKRFLLLLQVLQGSLRVNTELSRPKNRLAFPPPIFHLVFSFCCLIQSQFHPLLCMFEAFSSAGLGVVDVFEHLIFCITHKLFCIHAPPNTHTHTHHFQRGNFVDDYERPSKRLTQADSFRRGDTSISENRLKVIGGLETDLESGQPYWG